MTTAMRGRLTWSRMFGQSLHCRIEQTTRFSRDTGTCYKKIREYISEKDKAENIIDLTDDGPAFTQETTSRSQFTRVTLQCFVTYNTMQRLESRDSDEIKMLSGVLQEAVLSYHRQC